MAKKKFKATPFKKWLDELARVIVKTRDGWTCQINQPGCAGGMVPGDENCDWHHIIPRSECGLALRWSPLNSLTSCRNCHTWVTEHKELTDVWFASKYPVRDMIIRERHIRPIRTWHREDYERVEDVLIRAAIRGNVDYLNIKPEHRAKFKRKVEELLCEL